MGEQTRFSVTDVAKLVKLSRQTLYRNYINKGVLSVTKKDGNTYIELVELLRVFPDVTLDVSEVQHNVTQGDTIGTAYLTRENELLRNQLRQAQDREEWLKAQLEKTTQLLENKTFKRKKFLGFF